MGHVTIVHEDLNEARTIAEEVKKKIRVIAWFGNLILKYAAWGIEAASFCAKWKQLNEKFLAQKIQRTARPEGTRQKLFIFNY
jgi:hypothetical protein